jgi:hypothetical protein
MKKGKEAKQEDYAAQLAQSFEQWQDIYENGCGDPFWADGVNLNLVRNHIFYFKRMIRESMTPEAYPEVYHRPEPPLVEYEYVVQADAIRRDAGIALELYRKDAGYQFLQRRHEHISPRDREGMSIDAVLGYCAGLEDAIARDDLVTMRRHRNAERYLASFAECAAKVRDIDPQRLQAAQLRLF